MEAAAARRAKAEELAKAGAVHPVPGLVGCAVVRGSQGALYLTSFAPGEEFCTCADWMQRQGKVGGRCKHIQAAKLEAGLDDQAEQIARIKGRRSVALLNGAEEEYDRLSAELNRFGAA